MRVTSHQSKMRILKCSRAVYCFGFILLFITVIIFSNQNIKPEAKHTPFMNVSRKFQSFLQVRNTSFNFREETMRMNEAKVPMDDWRFNSAYSELLERAIQLEQGFGRLTAENGFFIEAGAFDGEFSSTSLYFEKYRKWNGLLVEPDPIHFIKLQAKHRKAYRINACLSTKPYPTMVTYNMGYGIREQMGRVHETKEAEEWIKKEHIGFTSVKVQCFPLYSLLLAMEIKQIDFFSLDVEGEELHVLETIPFDKINIRIMTVEYLHSSEEGITRYLEERGYKKTDKIENFGLCRHYFRKN